MEFTALALENCSVHFSTSSAATRLFDKSMYPKYSQKKEFKNLCYARELFHACHSQHI